MWCCYWYFVCIANLKIREIIKEKFRKVGDCQITEISEEQKAMELAKTKICLVLAFSFVIFWMPSIFINVVANIPLTRDYDFSTMKLLGALVALLNAIFDPVFTSFAVKDFELKSRSVYMELKDVLRHEITI